MLSTKKLGRSDTMNELPFLFLAAIIPVIYIASKCLCIALGGGKKANRIIFICYCIIVVVMLGVPVLIMN